MQTNIPLSDLPGWAVPFLVVMVAVQLGIEVYAIVVMMNTPVERLVFGKRWPWVLIILFVNLIGAVVFLAAGRTPLPAPDPLAARPPDAPPVTGGRAARAVDVLYGRDDGATGGDAT